MWSFPPCRAQRVASAALLLAALDGVIVMVTNVPLVVEYEATCSVAEHQLAAGLDEYQVRQFLDALAAAVNGRVDAIVTFNLRDFRRHPLHESEQIVVQCRVCSGRQHAVTRQRDDGCCLSILFCGFVVLSCFYVVDICH